MPLTPNERKGPEEQQISPEETKKMSNMVKFLSRAFVQTQTFGIDHPLAKQPIEQCFTLLHNIIEEKGEIILYIVEKKLRYGQTILERKNPVVDRMIALFTTVQLVSLGFERGFSREDFLRLLSVFAAKPEDILSAGGVEKLVKERNVGHLKLNPIKYELIGQDEKVVSEDATAAEEALKELQAQLAEKEAKEEKEKPEELLSLIDESLKEDADQSLFTDKLTENPLEAVNLITEAIRMLNKVGGENAKPILSSIVNKLALVGDDLYRCLREGKDGDKAVKQTYKAAGILGKELTKRIDDIQVAPELNPLVQEMTNVLIVLMDQIEAQKILSIFGKGKTTLTKKVNFLKKIMQREKSSPEFQLLMKKLLAIKGMSEEEIKDLIDGRAEILEEAEKEEEGSLTQDLSSTLQKVTDKQMSVDEALPKLKDVIVQSVKAQMKSTARRLKKENEMLTAQTKMVNNVLGNIAEGIIVLDEKEKVIFINKSAQGLTGLNPADKIDQALSALFKNWQAGEPASLEQLLKDQKISEDKQEVFRKIASCLKAVQKNEQGRLNSVIFNPA